MVMSKSLRGMVALSWVVVGDTTVADVGGVVQGLLSHGSAEPG
jgi:hypothetical protein